MTLIKTISLINACFLIGCANIVSPSGGEKDLAPPQVLATLPEHQTTNYNRNEIALTFDEFIQLSNPAQQVIVSPPVNEVTFRTRGKSVYLQIEDTLLPNTTYTINFGEAIRDINEGNILQNYRLVFSTGAEIDTMTASGRVINAFSGQSSAGVTVMLYDNLTDSVVFLERPYYVSKSDALGNFNFTNLKGGVYKIFALEDKNSNYIYDPLEAIAFDSKPVTISESPASITLKLFAETPRLKVRDIQNPKYGMINVVLNTPIDSIAKIKTDPVYEIRRANPSNDTISYWFTSPYLDSAKVILEQDTSFVRMKSLPKDSIIAGKKFPKTFLATNLINDSIIPLTQPLKITFDQPVTHYDLSNVSLREGDSLLTFSSRFSDSSKTILEISYPWKDKELYTLFVPDSAFVTIFGMNNPNLTLDFAGGAASQNGTLVIKTALPDTSQSYLVQLFEVRPEAFFAQYRINPSLNVLTIHDLPPGNYAIRIIIDANRNNKWDTGNYLSGLQPEEVIASPNAITIKADWETEIEIKP